jgi:16S rRNA (uracil1498-N3)-methyltransferase
MRVAAVIDWEKYCGRVDAASTRLVAHPHATPAVAAGPVVPTEPPSGFCLAVGPEGGFTEEEVQAARQAGWQVVDLGPRILRVETAALVLTAWAVGRSPCLPRS